VTRRSILLVEDDPSLRKLLEGLVADAGHRVLGAATTQDALRLARETPFDLAVVDGRLENGELGSSLIRALLAESLLPAACIVYMSGLPEAAIPRGVRVLAKPIGAREFLALLKTD